MKKLATVLASLFLVGVAVFSLLPSILAADDSSDESTNGTITTVFKIEGMTCGGCEVGVRLNVKKLDGIEMVEVSYERGSAEITYDPARISPEQIEAAIEELGYEAEPQEPEETNEPSGR